MILRRKSVLAVENLDPVDRRLLKALQEDGRLSNAELARRCNLSPAACFERVKRLRERKVITGYAAEEILHYATEIDADLIIMATHGRRGIDRILFGSVAEKVVKNALQAVLTIHPKE